MNDRLKETFDKIYAEEELKSRTKEFISHKISSGIPQKKRIYRQFAPVMACFLFLMLAFGGYQLYFTQTSIISIDINPSIELNINRFGKVISVNSYNGDGLELANSIHIQFMDYTSAVDEILKNESIVSYLNKDEMLSISVVGQNEQKNEEMLANIRACIPNRQNVCCYMADYDMVNEAHSSGLSVGKYRAFLELQKTNPDITADDVKGLTMRQIRDLTDNPAGIESCPNSGENTGNGKRHRYRRGMEE